ncbi:MAG: hypothetical protein D6805_03040 [Planctomycetota bacterium]|nr:MAG: hypothetical protein D6805_03040 [Planctomycetota bacterium]
MAMRYWIPLFLIGLASCASEQKGVEYDMDSMEYKTIQSNKYLRRGRSIYDRLISKPNVRAEDFEEAIQVWNEGLKILPTNTLIRYEIVKVLYHLGKAYMKRMYICNTQAQKAKENGDFELAQKKIQEGKLEEQKAIDAYTRFLKHITILLRHRKPHDRQEEEMFFEWMVIANIQIKRFQEALRLIQERLAELTPSSPKYHALVRVKEEIQKEIEKQNL